MLNSPLWHRAEDWPAACMMLRDIHQHWKPINAVLQLRGTDRKIDDSIDKQSKWAESHYAGLPC